MWSSGELPKVPSPHGKSLQSCHIYQQEIFMTGKLNAVVFSHFVEICSSFLKVQVFILFSGNLRRALLFNHFVLLLFYQDAHCTRWKRMYIWYEPRQRCFQWRSHKWHIAWIPVSHLHLIFSVSHSSGGMLPCFYESHSRSLEYRCKWGRNFSSL